MRKLLVAAACAAITLVVSVGQTDSQTKENPLRVGGVIRAPQRTRTVVPSYPSDASSGTIVLELKIDPRGRVDAVNVVRGVPGATGAAVAAVLEWEYTPTLLNGEPIWLIMTVSVPSPWSE